MPSSRGKWTHTTPKVDGWYWVRGITGDGAPTRPWCAKIMLIGNVRYVLECGEETPEKLKKQKGIQWWTNRILEPWEEVKLTPPTSW